MYITYATTIAHAIAHNNEKLLTIERLLTITKNTHGHVNLESRG